MLSIAQPGQKSSFRWMQSEFWRLWMTIWASSGALVMRSLRGRVIVGLRIRRREELGNVLERKDAGEPAVGAGHRRVLSLALEQVGQRLAPDAVEVDYWLGGGVRYCR